MQRALHGDPDGTGFVVAHEEVSARLELPASGSATVYQGGLSPIFGWVSREFDRRKPSPTLVWAARLSGRTVLRTTIEIGEAGRR